MRPLDRLRVWLQGRPRAVAAFDDRGASCRWPDGTVDSIAWDELQSIEVRTSDAGPFAEDVFLVLRAAGGDCAVPQGAEGFVELLRHVQRLPGFDGAAVVSAMACTENATFVCWRRADDQAPGAAP